MKKTKLSLVIVLVVLIGCGSDDVATTPDASADHKSSPVAQAGIVSTIEPMPSNPSACNLNGPFLTIGDPSDVSDSATCGATTTCPTGYVCNDAGGTCSGIIPTGTGDVVIQCSVIPAGNGFQVDLEALITGGSAPATLHITGLLTPRKLSTSLRHMTS